MGLYNITIPERKITIGAGHITVRGISLSDLMIVIDEYGPQASLAFAKVQGGKSLKSSDVRALIGSLAREFPDMVSAAIALAADSYDDETVTIIKKLNFQHQIELIEAIFTLTFSSEGDIKKLMESLNKMLAEVSGALTMIQLPSQNGIGESAVQ